MNVGFHDDEHFDGADFEGDEDYDDYGSDNSSLDSFELDHVIPDEKKKFETRFKNRQIETLKYLRQALKENRNLKTRLTIVEGELERYQLFKSFSPLKQPTRNQPSQNSEAAAAIHRSEDKTAESTKKNSKQSEKSLTNLATPKTSVSKNLVDVVDKPNAQENLRASVSQYVQTTHDYQQVQKVSEATQASLSARPSVANDPPARKEVVKVSNESQTDMVSIEQLEKKIHDMTRQLGELNSQHDAKVRELEDTNQSLRQRCDKLTETVQTLHKNNDVTNEKLAELSKTNLKLSDDTKKQNELKETVNLLRVENEQIYLELQGKEGELNMRKEEIAQLTKMLEKFNDTIKAYEEQKIIISNLKAENDKHLKEKHLICQQKINELSHECRAAKDTIETQRAEIEKWNQLNKELNKNLEKIKLEQQNFNFKEFIALKRELNALKQERERDFVANVTVSSNQAALVPVQNPLPPLKEGKKNIFNFFNDN